MNSTTSIKLTALSFLISDEDVSFSFLINIASFVGLITNTINIRTFIIIGIKDGVSVTFLALALSDLGVCSFNFIASAASIIGAMELRYDVNNLPVQPRGVIQVIIGNMSLMFFQLTCMTTTFLAVARCMCVAMPFRFRRFFTRSRSVFAQVIFAFVSVGLYSALISQTGTRLEFDPIVNKTRYVLWLSSIRSEIKEVVSFISLYFSVYLSNIVVIICVLIMAKFLQQSVKFRNMASGENFAKDEKKISTEKLSGKEMQVVRQVIVVCIMYSTCTVIPTLVLSLMEYVVGSKLELDLENKYQTIFLVVSGVQYFLYVTNSATTFFVYYAFNSKFRTVCFAGTQSANSLCAGAA